MIETERPRRFDGAVLAVPYAGFEKRRIEVRSYESFEKEIPVASGENIIDGAVLHRLLGHRGHMVAYENGAREKGKHLLHPRDPLPVTPDYGSLGLHDDEIGLERYKRPLEFVDRHLGCDRVEEENVVPRVFQHRRRRGGHDRKNVGRTGEPLKLAVLREKSDPLIALQRRIYDCDFHQMPCSRSEKPFLPSYSSSNPGIASPSDFASARMRSNHSVFMWMCFASGAMSCDVMHITSLRSAARRRHAHISSISV